MREEDDESRLILNLPKMGAYIPQKLRHVTMEWNTMVYHSEAPPPPPPLVGCPSDSAQLDIWDSNELASLFHRLSAHHSRGARILLALGDHRLQRARGHSGWIWGELAVLLYAFCIIENHEMHG